MTTRLLLAVAAVVAASVDAQVVTPTPTCAFPNLPTLCDSTNVELTMPDQCADVDFPTTTMIPCCRLHTELGNRTCQLPEPPTGRCRHLSLDAAACPPDAADFCAVKDMTLRLDLNFIPSNETCCDKCNCYGDPHCESFTGKADTWIICDARTPTPDGKCAMTKAQCLSQTDPFGNQCQWQTNADGSKWVVGVQGSPCIAAQGPGETPPSMLMYRADDFNITLTMGERAIIKHAIITDGGKSYVISADLCFDDPVSNFAWRESLTQVTAPTDPSWLPRQWFLTPLDGGDILWSIFNLPSQIEIAIRCTRTREVKNGRVRYSTSRLNVEQLIEPRDWRGQGGVNARKIVGGFCPNGTIHKLGSTAVTDNIVKNGLCEQAADELEVAKLLCGNPTTKAGIPGCKSNWCKSVRLLDWEDCYNDIADFGWTMTWCAVNTMLNEHGGPGVPEDCDNNANCKKCNAELNDFGWAAGIPVWQGSVVSDAECTPRNELPEDLVDCQAGVKIQYEASKDVWVTYLSIPQGTVLCGNHLDFDSTTDPELFQFPIRINQCSLPRGCLVDKCVPEMGFNANFKFTAIKTPEASLLDAWNNELIICDPVKFPGLPNPWACLPLMPPTGLCPCPAPSG